MIRLLTSLMVFSFLFASPVMAEEYEGPKYSVIKADGPIELRRYEPMLTAEVTMAGNYKGMQNDAFWVLADYIFGKNEMPNAKTSEKIAMTAPVTIEPASEKIAMTAPVTIEPAQNAAQEQWTMRFMMPAQYTKKTLPKPKDDRVKIVELEGFDALSYRFSWWFSKNDLDQYSKKLKDYAEKNGLTLVGEAYSAVYNDPFTLPFLRRNEVIWHVEKVKK